MREAIQKIIQGVVGADVPVEVVVSERLEFGNYSTSVAMRLAKERGENPLAFAESMAEKVRAAAPLGFFSKVEAVAPGFVNFWLSNETTQKEFARIAQEENFGVCAWMNGRRVMVEYTDPNPFKQFHIGHLVTNVIGEAIARLCEASGAEVLRVNYQGDVGVHVASSVWGMMRMRDELPGDSTEPKVKMKFLGRAYAAGVKAYREDVSAKSEIDALNKKIYEKSDNEINKLYDLGRAWSLDYFETIYARLGTKFTQYFFESEVGESGVSIVKAYPDVFVESEGAIIFRGEQCGLHNRVFINSLGLPTYEAKELGLTKLKLEKYNPDESIVVTGNEIDEYFRVLIRAMEFVMPDAAAKTKHIGHGMLRLPTGKMSSRTGDVFAAEDFINTVKGALDEKMKERAELDEAERESVKESVALSAIRYAILKQGIGKNIIFDAAKSISFQGDSGPYIQYTYARLKSILRKSEIVSGGDHSLLSETEELSLMNALIEFPYAVRSAAMQYAPHILALYLYELSNHVNLFYEKVNILKEEDGARRSARLSLARVSARTLKRGLGILGIEAPEKI